MAQDTQIIAELTPSPMRRVAAVLVMLGLGVLCANLGIAADTASALVRFLMIAMGAGAAWLALRCWRATARGLVLYADGTLCESGDGGRVLAQVSDIKSVARGPLATKPSQGLTLVLGTSGPAGWAPGLWWRLGKRLGLGGVTRAHEGKAMAEAIEMMRITSR